MWVLVAVLATVHLDGHALPQGRAWTPDTPLFEPGFVYLTAPRLDYDAETGTFRMAASAFGFTVYDAIGYQWADSQWTRKWSVGHGTLRLWPVQSPPGTYHVIYGGGDDATYGTQFMAELIDDDLVVDTIAPVAVARTEYAAAVSKKRRWAAVSDLNPNLALRAFYSDTVGVWHELASVGLGDGGITMGVVDDTTALIVWGGMQYKGLKWATISGSQWIPGNAEIPVTNTRRVRMRPHPEGGFWVAWASLEQFVPISRFTTQGPTTIDTLWCNYPVVSPATASPYLSRDEAIRPVVAWSWTGNGDGICICFPTDTGYEMGENIPNAGSGDSPAVAVDPNGDTWLAWKRTGGTVHWMHTYVTATTAAPTASRQGQRCVLTWTLSEPAPSSWWAVLRSPDGVLYEEVARVQAGGEPSMSWTDPTPLSGVTRYRIRRENVDKRYEWLSEPVLCDAAVSVQVSLASAVAESDRVTLRWQGRGAGALDATVERRGESTGWQQLGPALADGSDRLAYEDRSVVPGSRYGYRLAYLDQGVQRFTAESWATVPNAFELALEGFRPNPATADAVISFSLPARGTVRLEVVDVAGRRVFTHDAGELGPGRHVFPLNTQPALAPGVYVIRMTFGSRVLQTRGVVVR
jgi:hypothetical protein